MGKKSWDKYMVFNKCVRSSMLRTDITLKFRMSRLRKAKKTTATTRKAKENRLISRPKVLQMSKELLIDSKKCNQRQNSLSTWIWLNLVWLQIQSILLNFNIATAFQYNNFLGTHSKASSFIPVCMQLAFICLVRVMLLPSRHSF